ncbi:unnamed protein product, partial [Nesidiocoris tenuis]
RPIEYSRLSRIHLRVLSEETAFLRLTEIVVTIVGKLITATPWRKMISVLMNSCNNYLFCPRLRKFQDRLFRKNNHYKHLRILTLQPE